ncbi:uncharacterized protein J7T54_006263 [Emericellopsis cladophorae]|uniref:NACHT domain-containing protein n=1 Tax=Emericellopsis cladophorae TaxID=2686198 RepID=A0A9P9YAD6_9HYPO|nr:uncharacterized protein J7T54_006263 [Emericellopsis cladophorae]KAI6785924.1 hypothetical protein J7T54_006263 [Emericellopsis cladophorae]
MADPQKYTVGWICALSVEFDAAQALLDEEHDVPVTPTNDNNNYALGRIGNHNVVIAVLPDGEYGTSSAAAVARDMLRSFPNVRIGLMVGIGGGAPSPKHDVRLGDVVVSSRDGGRGGVFQYDYGKAVQHQDVSFQEMDFLDQPPMALRTAVSALRSKHKRKGHQLEASIEEALREWPRLREEYSRPPAETDRLYRSQVVHPDSREGCGAVCSSHPEHLVVRTRRGKHQDDPAVHYGLVASANKLVKDVRIRDKLAEKGVLCFEMEAAGLMNHFPCLVVRGICDYADSHKSKDWQGYAAMVAAAYAKELLQQIQPSKVEAEKRIAEILDAIDRKVDGVQQTVSATKSVADSIKSGLHTHDIERWLRPPDPSTNANHARKLRHEGTGAWLLAHPAFQSWKSGSRRHMWLHGLAGCGKTVLSATVLDELAAGKDRLLVSFFFDFGDTTKQSVDGMLRSIAFQLYQLGAGSSVLDFSFQAHQGGSQQPASKTLEDIVMKMLTVQKKVSVILDALDESTTRSEVLSWMEAITSRPELAHVQLLCTSRPELEFQRNFPELIGEESCLILDRHAVDRDIRSYVTAQLAHRRDFREKRLPQDLLERIQSKVGDGADGMFRWAFCQLDSLARCRHATAMERALACLPRNLDETYRRMLESVPEELKRDALRLLQFLVHSTRPLRLAEAVEVIATQTAGESAGFDVKSRLFSKADVLEYCPSLVVVVHAADDELHLSHFSVKEYLLGIDQMQLPAASISITKTCLVYLTDIGGNQTEIKQNFPMARFAAEAWVGFAASAQASRNVLEASVSFLGGEATFQRWCRLYQQDRSWDNDPGPPRGSRLYYACLGGLYGAAELLLDKGADVKSQGGLFGNSLQAASSEGYIEVVRLLLDKGADVKAQGGFFGNALQAASWRGNIDIVRLLLEKGADVNAQGGRRFGNSLQAASWQGHIEVVRLLLEKGADVKAQGGEYGNALQVASWKGNIDIVRLLLEKGADVKAQGGRYGNALQAASGGGHDEVVRLLLDEGADVKAQGGEYGNALQAASCEGYIEVVRLLLDEGADVKAQGGQFGNALQAASWRGNIDIVRLLLEKGADVKAQGGGYGNALQAASWRGNIDVVRLLLEKGADVKAQGGRYGNSVQAASRGRHDEVVKILLQHQAHAPIQKRVASTPPAEPSNKRLAL